MAAILLLACIPAVSVSASAQSSNHVYQMGQVTVHFSGLIVGGDTFGIYMELNGYMPEVISETISGDFTEKELQASIDNTTASRITSISPVISAPSIYAESASTLSEIYELSNGRTRNYSESVYQSNRTLTSVSYSVIRPGNYPVEMVYITGMAANVRVYYDQNGSFTHRQTTHRIYMDGQLLLEYSGGTSTSAGWYKVHQADFRTPENPKEATANPTASKVFVDGEQVEIGAYLINDNNYIKLRDIAYILNGTVAQFDTVWHQDKNLIEIQRGAAYKPVGGEMQKVALSPTAALLSTAQLMYEDEQWSHGSPADLPYEIPYTNLHTEERTSPLLGTITVHVATYQKHFLPKAYNINGNNFYKLRDIAHIAGFNVDWDAATNSVLITTN